jgi:hypothetical protein
MNSNDVNKLMKIARAAEGHKLYLAPGFKRLSPVAAEGLLLRKADTTDPQVRRMLDRIKELREDWGSGSVA